MNRIRATKEEQKRFAAMGAHQFAGWLYGRQKDIKTVGVDAYELSELAFQFCKNAGLGDA
jgi:hypothetical protein